MLDVLAGVFASDVLVLNGLDDRRESNNVLEQAEQLMADAVRTEHAYFSTCGSSLSVKTAIMSVTGPGRRCSSRATRTSRSSPESSSRASAPCGSPRASTPTWR